MNNTLQQKAIEAFKEYSGTAIKCREKTVTYAELDSVTDNIAVNLAIRGIGPGSVVCVKMKRTEKMIMALCGVIKSGAALVPVQNTAPEKRFSTIMDAVNASLLITDDNFDPLCEKSEAAGTALRMAAPDDLALILFTSGSTGTPKGVCHTQYSCISTAYQYPCEVKNIAVNDMHVGCTIAKTGMDYVSAYIFEYMPFIASGIPMVLLTEDEANSADATAKVISENKDCSLFLTPSQADNYIKHGALRNENLSCLVLAGEPLPDAVRKAITENTNEGTQVISCYGSTECHLITMSSCRSWETANGVIMDNYSVLILDGDSHECETGIDGDIVVSGPGVFTKYIGADDRRIDISGKSYSYTGDYGEKTEDGRVIIKGRTDRMIKYHGLRVELGDIENNISQYPGIKAVAVTEADTEAGTRVLCAYYESDEKIDVREMRRFLMERLPVSMVPSGFIRLEKLPVNERGKIDFKDLRSRVFVPEDEKVYSEISAEAEQASKLICRMISELLRTREPAKPEDNLFGLGMDSIQAYNLIDGLENSGYTVSIEQIFMNPVISDLANVIMHSDASNKGSVQKIDTEKPYTATVEQAFWFIDLSKFKYFGYYVSDCFISGKTYTKQGFESRVKDIVARHPAFTADISFNDGMPSQKLSKTPNVRVDYFDISGSGSGAAGTHQISEEQEQYIGRYRAAETQEVLMSEEITDFKATYFAINADTGVITFTCNHAETDGASMMILREEFLMDELPETKDSYAQYLDYMGDMNSIGEAVGFWSQYLKGAEPAGIMPEGNPLTPDHIPDFRTYVIRLDKENLETYKNRCAKDGVSPVGYINYAYGKAMLEVLKKQRIIIQLLTAGRGIHVKGISRTVGCILEKIPVVIAKDTTPEEFQKDCMQCDRYSFLNPAMIWQPVTGSYEPPQLAPYLTSEVFPPDKSGRYCSDYNNRDYEGMMESNFITMDENELKVIFHYDVNALPETEMTAIVKETEKKIMEYR